VSRGVLYRKWAGANIVGRGDLHGDRKTKVQVYTKKDWRKERDPSRSGNGRWGVREESHKKRKKPKKIGGESADMGERVRVHSKVRANKLKR